jgi:hypothetical protein
MTDAGPTIGLVLDCHEPTRLADFWAAALDYVSLGVAGAFVVLLPNGRPGPKLLLQQVPERKTVKNHIYAVTYGNPPDPPATTALIHTIRDSV